MTWKQLQNYLPTNLSAANGTSVELKYKKYNSPVVMCHISRSDFFRCIVFMRWGNLARVSIDFVLQMIDIYISELIYSTQ